MEKLLMKYRVLWIVVIVLICINIATLGAIFWQVQKFKNIDKPFNPPLSPSPKHFQQFVIEKLQLDSVQQQKFLVSDSIFRFRSRIIFEQMHGFRKKMMDELLKSNPDTILLQELNKQLAIQHVELKKTTFEHFLNLKKICRPEQQQRLNEHIQNTFKREIRGFPMHKKQHKCKRVDSNYR